MPTARRPAAARRARTATGRVDGDPVEHDRRDHLVGPRDGLEHPGDAAPDRAADHRRRPRRRLSAGHAAEVLAHPQRGDEPDPVLALAADVEQPAAEREGDREAGEDERRGCDSVATRLFRRAPLDPDGLPGRGRASRGRRREDDLVGGERVVRPWPPPRARRRERRGAVAARARARREQARERRPPRTHAAARGRRRHGQAELAARPSPRVWRSSDDPPARTCTRMRSARSSTSSSSNDTSRMARPGRARSRGGGACTRSPPRRGRASAARPQHARIPRRPRGRSRSSAGCRPRARARRARPAAAHVVDP